MLQRLQLFSCKDDSEEALAADRLFTGLQGFSGLLQVLGTGTNQLPGDNIMSRILKPQKEIKKQAKLTGKKKKTGKHKKHASSELTK